MDRRNFFKTMVGGVAAVAAVRTFPFKIFSFPQEVKVLKLMPNQIITGMAFKWLFG